MKRLVNVAVYVGLIVAILIVAFVLSERNELLEFHSAAQEQATNARATAGAEAGLRATAEAQHVLAIGTAEAEVALRGTAEAGWTQAIAAGTELTTTLIAELDEQEQQALAYQLALQADQLRSNQPHKVELSALLAIEAAQRETSVQTTAAVREAVALLPRHLWRAQGAHPSGLHIVWSEDGRYVASAGQVWDVKSGLLITQATNERVLAFSANGRYVATYSDSPADTVHIRELPGGIELFQVPAACCEGVTVFSPNSRYVATEERVGDSDWAITVREIATGQEIFRTNQDMLAARLAFTLDSNYLARAGHFDQPITVWNIHDATSVEEFPLQPYTEVDSDFLRAILPPERMFFTASNYLALATDSGTGLWNQISSQLVEFPTVYGRLEEFSFSSDGRFLLGTRSENAEGDYHSSGNNVTQVWEVANTQEYLRVDGAGASASFDSSSHFVTTIGRIPLATWPEPYQVQRWHIESGRPAGQFIIPGQEYQPGPRFSPNGATIVTSDLNYRLNLWDAHPFQPIIAFDQTVQDIYYHSIEQMAGFDITPGGDLLATSLQRGPVRLWNVEEGVVKAQFNASYVPDNLLFSPDGRYLAMADNNPGGPAPNDRGGPAPRQEVGYSHLWDMETGQIITMSHETGLVNSIAFTLVPKLYDFEGSIT